MPALENNLFYLFFVLLGLAVLGGLVAVIWKPVLRRVWRYFQTWWNRDKIAEAEAKRLKECRQQAEREIREAVGETILETPQPAAKEPASPQVTKPEAAEPAPTVIVTVRRPEQEARQKR